MQIYYKGSIIKKEAKTCTAIIPLKSDYILIYVVSTLLTWIEFIHIKRNDYQQIFIFYNNMKLKELFHLSARLASVGIWMTYCTIQPLNHSVHIFFLKKYWLNSKSCQLYFGIKYIFDYNI